MGRLKSPKTGHLPSTSEHVQDDPEINKLSCCQQAKPRFQSRPSGNVSWRLCMNRPVRGSLTALNRKNDIRFETHRSARHCEMGWHRLKFGPLVILTIERSSCNLSIIKRR